MGLIDIIDKDVKQAMLARDAVRLSGLRSIKAALLLARTDENAGGVITPETELKVLQKLARQRRESAGIYREQNRSDLEETELAELRVIEEYLPKQLTPEELEGALKKIIAETGASSIRDMGKVMGRAGKELAGKADGKTLSEAVKRLLS